MRAYYPRPACYILAVFHRFHTKVGQFLLHNTTQTAYKLDAFLLLSINGDLRLTLADVGFHYNCQRYFSKRTRCLGRFLELQCCGILPKLCATRSNLFKRVARIYGREREARLAESSVCLLDFCRFFYFLTIRKHFTAV